MVAQATEADQEKNDVRDLFTQEVERQIMQDELRYQRL
jgi:hypothetical protein